MVINQRTPKRIAFIINGSRPKALKLADALSQNLSSFGEIIIRPTTHKGHAADICGELAGQVDCVVAIGGDGTVNECVNGLMLIENPDQRPVLAVLPSGSGNDFARNFKWKASEDDLIHRLEKFSTLNCDVFCLNYHGGEKEYFINIADAGLGPAVVQSVNRLPQRWSGNLKFGLSVIQNLVSYRKKDFEVKYDQQKWSGKALTVVAANGKYFGSGIGIAPEADLSDGKMELVIIGNVSVFTYLMKLPKLRKGLRIEHPEVHYLRAERIEISGKGLMEKDGELGSSLPVQIESGGRLELLA